MSVRLSKYWVNVFYQNISKLYIFFIFSQYKPKSITFNLAAADVTPSLCII